MRDWIFVAQAERKIQFYWITNVTVLHRAQSDAVRKSFLTANNDNSNNNSEDHPAGILIIYAPVV